MATTPNFNWSTPDNTGLVKNGALDIRTLGNAIDASLVDLKGGTTGQVLAKASNTDMDFSWTTAGAGGTVYAAGKNAIINGGMDCWQRGTSFSVTTGSNFYTADRFFVVTEGATMSVARSTTIPSSVGVQYSLEVTGATSGTNAYVVQRIESTNVPPIKGTVTVSAYIYNETGASVTPTLRLDTPTAVDNYSSVNINTYTLQACANNAWTRVTQTVDISALTQIDNGLSVIFYGWTLNSNTKKVRVTGVQIERASSATAFTRNGATIQGELASCQRYYFRASSDSGYKTFGVGTVTGVNNMNCFVNLPVQMRTIPSALDTSAMSTFYWEPGGGTTPTSITLATSATQNLGNVQVSKNSSFTVGYATGLFSNNTAAYLGFSAEL
jgi:hypothetical protein